MKNNVNVTNQSLDNNLLSAFGSGDTKKSEELLEKGADVNANNATINIKSSYNEGPEDNSFILSLYYFGEGFPSEKYVYRISLSALIKACQKGHVDIVKLLINNCAKVNQINIENKTPLHFAAANGHLEVVQFLIEKGADVNKVNEKEGFIYLCRKLGVPKSIRMYLFDIKYAEDGLTALHLAAANVHKEVVQFLINNGAKVNQINSKNKTPLDIAIENGRVNEITILLAYVNVANKEGEIPLHLVSEKGKKMFLIL